MTVINLINFFIEEKIGTRTFFV